ncbi:MAG TPA: STAS-like domain-containing protein [Allosphingosinicella sp.]|jgi:hypothetical protein|nr:STAS-like domain-containing protein [Allosphingosinicella sp.]
MVVSALEVVPNCNTAAEGALLYEALHGPLRAGEAVTLSFAGADGVPSSFVNASVVRIVEEFGLEEVRQKLSIVNCTAQVADMLRRCIRNASAMA